MFMSTIDDRNHISNEWTHDKKLSKVDLWSNKWHKTYKNIHFLPFRHLVGLVVGRWFIFFCPRSTWVGRKKGFFLLRGWKKKRSCINFDGSVGKPETRHFFLGLKMQKCSSTFDCPHLILSGGLLIRQIKDLSLSSHYKGNKSPCHFYSRGT